MFAQFICIDKNSNIDDEIDFFSTKFHYPIDVFYWNSHDPTTYTYLSPTSIRLFTHIALEIHMTYLWQ